MSAKQHAKTTTREVRGKTTQARTAAAIDLGAVTTLPQFLTQTGKLSEAEMANIVDQARAMLEALYVHLPLKRAMHATDPVQRLKLLQFRLRALSERQFHDEMITIFADLRDLHTNYVLPDPYKGKVAFLPFLLEEFYEGAKRKYVVAKMLAGFVHATFKPGVIVESWSGIPIERAVELNADRQAGSNLDARHARGLEALTLRPMAMSSAPDEHWVIVGYRDGATSREIRVDWQVFEPDPGPNDAAGGSSGEGRRTTGGKQRARTVRSLGLDLRTEIARRAKKALFNPKAMVIERATGSAARARVGASDTSTMPDVFSFRSVTTPAGTFGYVRIWTFMVQDDDAFVSEFVRITGLLPKRGLIVDVRGNGGGSILCAEKLLQLLTPNVIEPTLLSFINSPLTREICALDDFAEWEPSIAGAVETGEVHSQGFPLLPRSDYNRLGQRYQGPVVLITDPLCYSATDIFSAGFQDNGIGPILSVGGRTGAGGANVWDHELLQLVLPGPKSPFSPLPKGASMRVAVRRVIRSGTHQGVPLEDLGVQPDAPPHKMTKRDLLNDNVDQIARAGQLLKQQSAVTLEATVSGPVKGKRTVKVTTAALDRVDVAVDDRPRATADVHDGTTAVEIPDPGKGAHDVAVTGFAAGVRRAVFHTAL